MVCTCHRTTCTFASFLLFSIFHTILANSFIHVIHIVVSVYYERIAYVENIATSLINYGITSELSRSHPFGGLDIKFCRHEPPIQ